MGAYWKRNFYSKASEILKGNLDKMLEEKSEDIKELNENHQKELNRLTDDYEEKLRNLRRAMDETKSKIIIFLCFDKCF